MPFDRIDTLIIRRLPRKGQEWTAFPIQDVYCIQALDLLVCSGCVERRAQAHWFEDRQPVTGFAVLCGDWRPLVSGSPDTGLSLQPTELKCTWIRLTRLGLAIRQDLFAGTTLAQSHAIQFIRHMCISGSIRLYRDLDLTRLAEPHPFDITPSAGDDPIYPDYEI